MVEIDGQVFAAGQCRVRQRVEQQRGRRERPGRDFIGTTLTLRAFRSERMETPRREIDIILIECSFHLALQVSLKLAVVRAYTEERFSRLVAAAFQILPHVFGPELQLPRGHAWNEGGPVDRSAAKVHTDVLGELATSLVDVGDRMAGRIY